MTRYLVEIASPQRCARDGVDLIWSISGIHETKEAAITGAGTWERCGCLARISELVEVERGRGVVVWFPSRRRDRMGAA